LWQDSWLPLLRRSDAWTYRLAHRTLVVSQCFARGHSTLLPIRQRWFLYGHRCRFGIRSCWSRHIFLLNRVRVHHQTTTSRILIFS
jgi:hypothetical protein